ncbi:MAG: hypothetical protein ACRC8B_15475 [Aeromonas sobria]|uniref:hypothetical protein n=1 Tax=Aeromonas sobria TaxID=646 RepID=UPI003F2F30D9
MLRVHGARRHTLPIRYPLSAIRYPLSAIRYPLSAIRYPLSAIRYPFQLAMATHSFWVGRGREAVSQ